MLKDVLRELKTHLKAEFPTYKIYEEYVRQGFQRPCFFIHIESVKVRQEVGNNYLFRVNWRISCYEKPLDPGGVHHLFKKYNAVALQLYDILAIDGFQVAEMSHEIRDDILMFSLCHTFYCKKEDVLDTSEKMIKLKIEME